MLCNPIVTGENIYPTNGTKTALVFGTDRPEAPRHVAFRRSAGDMCYDWNRTAMRENEP